MTNKEVRDMALNLKSEYQSSDPEFKLALATINVTEVNKIYYKALMRLLGMLLPYDNKGKVNPQVRVVTEALEAAEKRMK